MLSSGDLLLYNALMISKLWLKNFKLHASTRIEAAPITVLIGPNNSGKSSLFQALLSLRQAGSMRRPILCEPIQRQQISGDQPYLFPSHRVIDIGEFKDIVRHGQNEIQIGVTGTIHLGRPLNYSGPVDLELAVHVRDNRMVYSKGSVNSLHGRIQWEWLGGPAVSASLEIDGATLSFTVSGSFELLSLGGTSIPNEFAPEKTADLRELGQYLGNAPLQLLNSSHPIFPLRGFEEFGYPLPDAPAGNLERLTLADRTIAIASILAYDREMEDKLSAWLEGLLEIGIKVKLLPGKRVTIWSKRSDAGDSDTLFANEGTGANQLPFILVPIGLTPPDETILLCEPEAHLHPKVQSKLVSLLLTIAKKENRQFFIETHSEHVLHSFLHSVASGDLERGQLAIYYFEHQHGVAVARQLEVDEKGRVEGGLPGFFEHSLTELSEYLDALKKC